MRISPEGAKETPDLRESRLRPHITDGARKLFVLSCIIWSPHASCIAVEERPFQGRVRRPNDQGALAPVV